MTEAPVSYDAKKAGDIIGQSANWMKTQARAGKIPFTRVGRQMRWTPQQLAEILRAGEQKPRLALAPALRCVGALPLMVPRFCKPGRSAGSKVPHEPPCPVPETGCVVITGQKRSEGDERDG